MTETSEAYWARRAEEREAEWFKKSQQTIEKELAVYYEQSLQHIRDDIAVLYARFAADNNMDIAAAQELIKGSEFRVWRMEIEEYVKQIEASGSEKLLRELNTLAMRSRISRLDKLYSDTLRECINLGVKADTRMTAFLSDAFKDNYYHSLYEIGKKATIRLPVEIVNSNKLQDVLREPWSGKNYSQRIWKNTEKLAHTIQTEVVYGLHRGSGVQQISRRVSERMDVGRRDSTRLVRTELNYMQNKAALESMKDADLDYYIFMATLDRRTSTVCRNHDHQIYPVSEASPGTNMPPLHPRCRSTISASLRAGKSKQASRRTAGKEVEYHISANMTYKEWEQSFIADHEKK